jgi:type I restriction enzyme R subunit
LRDNTAFCNSLGVSLSEIENAEGAAMRLNLLETAQTAIVAPDEIRKTFFAQARLADRVYAAVKPHRFAYEFATRMATLGALVDALREKLDPAKADLKEVLAQIGGVLDRSIEGATLSKEGPPPIDLSKIDFKALAARFKESKTKSLDVERLKAAIRAQLERMIAANETRVDLLEKFEAMIEGYNAGSAQIEQLFLQLAEFSQNLTVEETRHVREQLSEEELTVFDLLTRPGPELSQAERAEVKKLAKQLLARLQGILTVDWQKTTSSRAKVKVAIEEALDEGLPRAYTPDVYQAKTAVVFQHVMDRYARAA